MGGWSRGAAKETKSLLDARVNKEPSRRIRRRAVCYLFSLSVPEREPCIFSKIVQFGAASTEFGQLRPDLARIHPNLARLKFGQNWEIWPEINQMQPKFAWTRPSPASARFGHMWPRVNRTCPNDPLRSPFDRNPRSLTPTPTQGLR